MAATGKGWGARGGPARGPLRRWAPWRRGSHRPPIRATRARKRRGMTEEFEEIEDLFGLTRPVRAVYDVAVTDPSQPGKGIWLSLRYVGAVEYGICADESERMKEMYLTGREGKPPGPFPLVG